MTLDEQARGLYDACETPKPTWDQLGETTKNVWRSYVNKDPSWPFLYKIPSHPSIEPARDAILGNLGKVTTTNAKLDETPIEEVVPANISVTTLEKVAEKIPELSPTGRIVEHKPELQELPKKLTLKEKLALKGKA